MRNSIKNLRHFKFIQVMENFLPPSPPSPREGPARAMAPAAVWAFAKIACKAIFKRSAPLGEIRKGVN